MSDRRITVVIMTRNRRDELLETLGRMTTPAGGPGRSAVPPICSTPIPGRGRSPVRSLPRDRASLGAIAEALGGLRRVLRERRVVPPEVERGLRLLEAPQRHSVARRYVG